MKISMSSKVAIATLVVAAGFAIAKPDVALNGNASGLVATMQKGNGRFVEGKSTFPHTGPTRRMETAKGQTPFATVLTCSDSRVPPEFIFDQGIGDLFTIRVAGNVADTDEIATIEYGVGHLKTPILIVMGHTSCGAVTAVIEKANVSQNIKWLVDNIEPAVARAKATHPGANHSELVDAAVEENVAQAIQDVLQRSKEVREKVAEGHLSVFGAVYNLQTGKVRWLGQKPEGVNSGGQVEIKGDGRK